jgi:hypothetical protein
MAEHHRGKTFGILENNFSDLTIRLHRRDRPAPKPASGEEYYQADNPYSKCHRIPFQNDDPFEISFIISRSPFQLKSVLYLQLGCRQPK